MKLYVNLIPAIAYALVTMFSNMAGLTREVEKPSKKQQIVLLQVRHHELNNQKNCVLVTKNEQITHDSFFEFFPGPFNAMDFSPSTAKWLVGCSLKLLTTDPSFSEIPSYFIQHGKKVLYY
jgi:hypothetical protein